VTWVQSDEHHNMLRVIVTKTQVPKFSPNMCGCANHGDRVLEVNCM
jgi:hypothetical protein